MEVIFYITLVVFLLWVVIGLNMKWVEQENDHKNKLALENARLNTNFKELAEQNHYYMDRVYGGFLGRHCDAMMILDSENKLYWHHLKLIYIQNL